MSTSNIRSVIHRLTDKVKAIALVLFCLCLTGIPAAATHIFGGELFYTHAGGNTYTVTMIIYGDCGGSALAFQGLTTATPQVEVYNNNNLIQTLTLQPQVDSGINVSPVCPDEANNTTCSPNGILPGVKKFIYAADIILSTTSANWKFRSLGDFQNATVAGRSSAITNIVSSTNSYMSLEATLDNTLGNNSSPTYTTIPTPFFCINKPQEYNQGAVDVNGDSLYFALVPGLNAYTTPSTEVDYINPYTATEPLDCAPATYVFNNNSGQLSFTPDIAQDALVVCQVSEYRNGLLVGTSMREMTFVVLNNCLNNPPDGTVSNPTNGILVDETTIKVCKADASVSFDITTADQDGDNVNLTYQGIPTGAIVSVSNNNTPSPIFSFSWNITNVTPGTYTFFLDYTDDGCPLSSKQTIAYTLQVLANPVMTYTLIQEATCVQKAVFTVAPIGNDVPYSLDVTQGVNSVLLVNNMTAATTDSLAAGTYNFRITGANGCFKDTAINITQTINIVPLVSWTQPFCPAGNTATITVSATGNNPPMQYAVDALPYTSGTTFSGLSAGLHVVHVKDNVGCIKDSSITITDPAVMQLSLDIHKPVCSPVSNGQITVAVTNGSAPYQYALNANGYSSINTFSGLSTGTYTVHVKDAHDCIRDTTITLVDSLYMQLQSVVTQALCFGSADGSITLTPSGTTAPYNYAIGPGSFGTSNIFNGLGAGTYVLHISDQNQCLKDTTITITQPTALAYTLDITQVTCFGDNNGMVLVNATGGTPAYQYAADNSIFQASNQLNGFNAGTHTIHLKDINNCLKDTVVTITQPATAVAFGVLSLSHPTCEGFMDGSVTLSANGGTPSYQFAADNDNFSPAITYDQLGEGTHIFKVKDNKGCIKDTMVTLTGFPHILIDEISFVEPTCFGYADGKITITASGGNPPFTYQLNNSGGWEVTPVFTGKRGQEYLVKVKDNNQCIKDTTVTLLQPAVLIVDTLAIGNDCNGVDDGGEIEVLASGGTAPYTYFWRHDANLHDAKISGLINGRYYVEVNDANGCADSATIDILYNNCCTPYIPNAFTPNGDGRNDNYKVEYKGDMDLKEMHIYNRYGQRIFTSSNVNKVWDGTFSGQAVDAGTYYYYIRILCGNVLQKELVFKGDITLIR